MSFHFRRAVRPLPPGRTIQEDVDVELDFHIASRTEELVRAGSTPKAARAQALREFGDVGAARSELARIDRHREARRARVRWWYDLGTDLRVALRTLLRRPGFALAALLTLALGIGANAAIFTVVDAALLHPLPYDDPGQLVHLWEVHGPDSRASEASFPDFLDWRAQSTTLSALAGYDETNVTVEGPAGAAMLRGARVTAGFFRLLGVTPVVGRSFAPEEDGPGGSAVVLLGDRYWRRELGADPSAVGRSLTIDHRRHTIIGVLPPAFRFAPAGDAELWLPIDRAARTRQQRGNHWLRIVGRLKSGVTPDAARRDLSNIMSRLAATYPETNAGRTVRLVPLREQVAGDMRPVLLALLAAVGVLLLMACFNVAGLVLTRSLARTQELGLRAAIGASRGRLVRQLVTESAVLAVGGALIGFLVARLGVSSLVAAAPAGLLDQMPYLRDVRPDWLVLLFTGAVTIFTALACGLGPAWLSSRLAVTSLLAGGARATGDGARRRVRDILVAAQLGLTAVLLIGAALVGRSMLRLIGEHAGFDTDHLLTARVPLAGPAYREPGAQQRFFATLLARVRALPGVNAVGAVTRLPLTAGGTLTYHVEGLPEPEPSAQPEVLQRGVVGDYFRALGIPLLSGRTFAASDDSSAPRVIVINHSLARRLFPAGDAVGRRFRFYALPDLAWQVVGVVGDVKTGALDAAPPPTIYYSHLQAAENRFTLVIRSRSDRRTLARAVRAQVRAMDPSLPVYQVATMADVVSDARPALVRRYALLAIGAFGLTALALAIIGVYGTVALSVTQRARELGIRAALGATRSQLLVLVLRRAAALVTAGVLAGGLLAMGFSRFLDSLLYRIPGTDPTTYLVVVVALGAAAVTASAVPARRAAMTNPAAVLREE